MGYCHNIAGECYASNNALKCAHTECPAGTREEDYPEDDEKCNLLPNRVF